MAGVYITSIQIEEQINFLKKYYNGIFSERTSMIECNHNLLDNLCTLEIIQFSEFFAYCTVCQEKLRKSEINYMQIDNE